MASMKDYFKVESKRLSDTTDILLHTSANPLSLSAELVNSAELPLSIKNSGGSGQNPILKSPSFSPILEARGASNFWEMDENFDEDGEDEEGAEEDGDGEMEKHGGDGDTKENGNGGQVVDTVVQKEESETLRKVKQRVQDLAEELERVKREKKANPNQDNAESLDNSMTESDDAVEQLLPAVPAQRKDSAAEEEQLLLTEVIIVDVLFFLFSSFPLL